MKKDCLVLRKPIHIGLLLLEKRGITYIMTDTHKTVFFKSESTEYKNHGPIILGENAREIRYYLFQYIEDNKEEVNCIGLLDRFTLIEGEYLHAAMDNILESNISHAIIKADYYDGTRFYYYVNSNYIIETGTNCKCTYLQGDFTDNENILLNYIFRKKLPKLSMEVFLNKNKEITEYVCSLDIQSIIDSYKIKRWESYRTKMDLYSTGAFGSKSIKDKYLDYLLPGDFYETNYKGFISDPVPEKEENKILECIASEGKIKELASTNYSREEHVTYLLYEYIKKEEEEREKYYNEFIIPKLIVWDTKYKREG